MESVTDGPRNKVLHAALAHAPFTGWTDALLRQAAKEAELPDGAETLYFPDGVLALIGYWREQINGRAKAQIIAEKLLDLKVRSAIRRGVWIWLSQLDGHEDAARRAASRLLMPDAAGQGPSQIWKSADMIWSAIGDTSVDGNYYSKRAILSAVLSSTLIVWLSDNENGADASVDNKSGDNENRSGKLKTQAFLDKRLENVMQFGRVQSDIKTRLSALPDMAQILGAMRYDKGPFQRRRRHHSRTL